eukprot:2314201-Alexandrium_andersonii.AAC.1
MTGRAASAPRGSAAARVVDAVPWSARRGLGDSACRAICAPGGSQEFQDEPARRGNREAADRSMVEG